MSAESWVAYAAFTFLICIVPGPAVILTMGHAAAAGMRGAVGVIAGIETANACYFALSGAGLGALILASEQALTIVKVAGAAYLIALGIQTLLSCSAGPASGGPVWRRPMVQGLVNQFANPKSILFYVAFLPQFLDQASSGFVGHLVLLALVGICIEIPVLLFYAMLGAAGGAWLSGYDQRWPVRLSGGALVSVGAALLIFNRD